MSSAIAVPEIAMSAEVQNLDPIDSTPTSQPPAPFAAPALEALTAKARDRRTLLLTELTSLKTRIGVARKELEDLQMQEYSRQEEVRQLGEWIDTCEALGTLSNIVEPFILHSPPAHHFKARQANEEYGFTAKECLRIISAEPGISLSSAEIRTRFGKPAMPLSIVSMRTNYLLSTGKIQRVAEGIYKATPMESAAPVKAAPVPRGPRFKAKPATKPKPKKVASSPLSVAPRPMAVSHAAQ